MNICKLNSIMILLWTLLLFFNQGSAIPGSHRRSLNSTLLDSFPQETCATENEEFVSTLSGVPRCCNKCPPGEGMLQLCTDYADTACRPCQDGADFSLEASATAKCTQCRQCEDLHPFARLQKRCTPTSDAVCECASGYYFLEATSTCQSCTKCPPSYGAVRACQWNQDSACKPCVEGTWSSRDSSVERCQACTKCAIGQIEMRACTATQNTHCCPLHNLNCQETSEAMEFEDPDFVRRQKQFADERTSLNMNYGDNYPMIAIYCSLLGLVILTLLIYVFYKLWQQKLSKEDAKTVVAGVFHPDFKKLRSNEGKPTKSKTSDREHLLGEPHLYSYASQKCAIPDTLLIKLSQGLAAGNRWKHFGAKLGFNEEALQNFEKMTSSKETDTNTEDSDIAAARQMLTTWYSTRATGDPAPLTSLLLILERTSNAGDLCRHLREYIEPSSVSPDCAISPSQSLLQSKPQNSTNN